MFPEGMTYCCCRAVCRACDDRREEDASPCPFCRSEDRMGYDALGTHSGWQGPGIMMYGDSSRADL